MRKVICNRKGSAIAFALFIAVTLLMSEVFLMYQNSNNIVVRQKSIMELQSYFAAKAALQHTLLKCQIMPTQLYDAASFAAGRNPYFDFGQYSERPASSFKFRRIENVYIKLANNINPGPRFLSTKTGITSNSKLSDWMEAGGFSSQDLINTANVSPWPNDSNHLAVSNPSLYLWKYYDDISFNSINFPLVSYPYNFSYDALELSVLAMQEQRKYKEEAVMATVVGRASFDGEEKETTISTTVRIKRNE